MSSENDTYNGYIRVVGEYLDHMLDIGKKETDQELFIVNGWNLKKEEPAKWRFSNGSQVIFSDLALQQNLLRILTGYAKITGKLKYEETACKMLRTYFNHYQHECGLLQWGGHRFLDYQHNNVVGIKDKKGDIHELKECFPYYDLMFQTDAEATGRYIRSFWNAHVYQWKTLEINRHGYYENRNGRLWASAYQNLEPFREAAGLSFLNAASDLIYAAGELFVHNKEKGALIWMTRMVHEYEKARDPVTKLGAYQFNRAKKLEEAVSDQITYSRYGDRAFRQLGMDFGEEALEGKMLLSQQAASLYYHSAVVWTRLGKQLGMFGDGMKRFVYTGMLAYAKNAYQAEDNTFLPMLTNGTSLLGYVLRKDGYYGKKGQAFMAIPADERFLYSYVVVYCENPDPVLWKVIRNICIFNRAGDPGEQSGHPVTETNLDSIVNDSELAVMAYVELYYDTDCEEYLRMACRIADNMIKNKYQNRLFVRSKKSTYADFDSVCPLALLQLHAAGMHKKGMIPDFMTGQAYIHGEYQFEDGTVGPYTTKEMFE